MLALRLCTGMARVITNQVNEIRHSNTGNMPMKRQQLRIFAEYVFGTFHDLLKHIDAKDAPRNAEEREFIKRLRMIERDLHTQLSSVGCDVGDDI
ncbi:hypothetical protein H9J74_001119 [Escherichia coli]|uniref:hypothetical protein n=1 Tax=Escherichia coli TaxID=562 RepID=UPI0010BC87D7|nr:hypothetical protein [Escherichia coli]EES9510125.1 hypothetical protein [Escherichia coli]EEV9054256.1 hypothetical protein [Escherichia coli]EEW1721950.1 hypothetical protein [Escherichia coli]EFH9178661.1 hypothetical protein [Escherichia coli]EFL9475418.1 hypothetical protein [Escherichia coli]